MPYEIRRLNGRHCVAKQGEADTMKCYDTKAEALKYLRALYANVPDARQMADEPIQHDVDMEAYDAKLEAAGWEFVDDDEETTLTFLAEPDE